MSRGVIAQRRADWSILERRDNAESAALGRELFESAQRAKPLFANSLISQKRRYSERFHPERRTLYPNEVQRGVEPLCESNPERYRDLLSLGTFSRDHDRSVHGYFLRPRRP